MTKRETGQISHQVADKLFHTFKRSFNEELFFLDTEYSESEKTLLMNCSQNYELGFRHFGNGIRLRDHHICIYKKKSALEIAEEIRKDGWKSPKYLITLKTSDNQA